MRKTSIFSHFGPKMQIMEFFGQNGQKGNFFKKALGKFLSRLQAITNCKVSEKSNERFSSNCVTYGRTYVHTNEHESLRSTDFVGRPKNQTILMRGFSGKWARIYVRTNERRWIQRSIDSVERPKSRKF